MKVEKQLQQNKRKGDINTKKKKEIIEIRGEKAKR